MKKQLLVIIISLISFSVSLAQGTIKGKITDESGDPLTGVVVSLKTNPAVKAFTDFDGFYSLQIIDDSTPQVIEVSYISFQNQLGTVTPLKGEVIIKDFVLTGQGVVTNIKEATISTDHSY